MVKLRLPEETLDFANYINFRVVEGSEDEDVLLVGDIDPSDKIVGNVISASHVVVLGRFGYKEFADLVADALNAQIQR